MMYLLEFIAGPSPSCWLLLPATPVVSGARVDVGVVVGVVVVVGVGVVVGAGVVGMARSPPHW
jgi:hypothetical protein